MATRTFDLRQLVTERFLLMVERFPEEQWQRLREDLILASQRRDAARALQLNGRPAAGLKLAREAFELVAPHAQTKHALAIEGLRTRVRELGTPDLDEDVELSHERMLRDLLRLGARVHRTIAPRAMSVGERNKERIYRLATMIALLAVLAIVGRMALSPRHVMRAYASAVWDPWHVAWRAIDDSPDTEWVLPDGELGWLDVWVRPTQVLHRVEVLNARSDRGTKDVALEIYSHGRLVKTIEATLPARSGGVTWTTIDVGSIPAVERVRFVVKTFHDRGAGFAEIKLE